ncbi:hypothetical protein [Shinella sp. WSJ-2]|uniref:hypothetical protein n=1 Tax=Shinella sp. WSJ-2 TaxID=2303749 RepID=UPI00131498F4|nr:hypothetical protein [Shinella sp. WSJ-2]
MFAHSPRAGEDDVIAQAVHFQKTVHIRFQAGNVELGTEPIALRNHPSTNLVAV